jgi:hypothetical protein
MSKTMKILCICFKISGYFLSILDLCLPGYFVLGYLGTLYLF